MWRLLVSAIAVFLGLPTITGIGSLVASAQTNVSFTEWTVPTKGSHPHDPLAAADGTISYTGQMASVLGQLNPRTGAFREYRTKTPDSGPHGLAADQEGNIWFTGNFAMEATRGGRQAFVTILRRLTKRARSSPRTASSSTPSRPR
jgi:streptogramin lyase